MFGERAEILRAELLPYLPEVLSFYFPSGKIQNGNFILGDAQGNEGHSLVVSIEHGHWKDFAEDGEQGEFITNLVAKKLGVSFQEALDDLERNFSSGAMLSGTPVSAKKKKPTVLRMRGAEPIPPGNPVDTTEYRDDLGFVQQYMFTYLIDGKEYPTPYTYNSKLKKYIKGKKNHKGEPVNLFYGVDVIKETGNIIIVEGEKCMKALQKVLDTFDANPYFVTTWPGGSSNHKFQSYGRFKDKRVILWPDKDDVGAKAMDWIAKKLLGTASVVKYVCMEGFEDKAEGWDCADAIDEGCFSDFSEFVEFLRPHIRTLDGVVEEDSQNVDNSLDKRREEKWESQVKRNTNMEELGLRVNTRGGLIEKISNYEVLIELLISSGMIEVWEDTVAGGAWVVNKFYKNSGNYGMPVRLSFDVVTMLQGMIEFKVDGITKLNGQLIGQAVNQIAVKKKSKNKYLDFISDLPKWDGVSRVENLFSNYANSGKTALNRQLGRIFMHALIARALADGKRSYKFDLTIILKGAGGIG